MDSSSEETFEVDQLVEMARELEGRPPRFSPAELRAASSPKNICELLNILFRKDPATNECMIASYCSILTVLLTAQSESVVLFHNEIASQLVKCLHHPHEAVQVFALQQYGRRLGARVLMRLLETDHMNFLVIVDILCSDNNSVSKVASDLIASLGRSENGTDYMCNPIVCEAVLKKFEDSSDQHKLRLLQAVIEIARSSDDSFESLEAAGYFDALVEIIERDGLFSDPSLIDIITTMGEGSPGFLFLGRHRITENLAELLLDVGHPLREYYFPSVAQFFAVMGQRYALFVESYFPGVYDVIFKECESGDQQIFVSALESIGLMARGKMGKELLMKKPSMGGIVQEIIAFISQEIPLWAIWGLRLLTDLVRSVPSTRTLVNLDTAPVLWFEKIEPDWFQVVSNLVKLREGDIRTAAIELIAGMAETVWGRTIITRDTALMECLLGARGTSCLTAKQLMELLDEAYLGKASEGVPPKPT